jgi:hypothetical protein
VYADYNDFYQDALREWFVRDIDDGELTWCPEWQLHAEAVDAVRGLWHAWENANQQVQSGNNRSAFAGWWANYAYPIMRELMNPRNSFRGCSLEKGHEGSKGNPRLP